MKFDSHRDNGYLDCKKLYEKYKMFLSEHVSCVQVMFYLKSKSKGL